MHGVRRLDCCYKESFYNNSTLLLKIFFHILWKLSLIPSRQHSGLLAKDLDPQSTGIAHKQKRKTIGALGGHCLASVLELQRPHLLADRAWSGTPPLATAERYSTVKEHCEVTLFVLHVLHDQACKRCVPHPSNTGQKVNSLQTGPAQDPRGPAVYMDSQRLTWTGVDPIAPWTRKISYLTRGSKRDPSKTEAW